jgi:hypothetical protein
MHIYVKKIEDTRHQLLSLSSKLYGGMYANEGIKDFHFAFTEGEDTYDINFEVLDSKGQIAFLELLGQSFEIIKIEPAKDGEEHEEEAIQWWRGKQQSTTHSTAQESEQVDAAPQAAQHVTTIYTFYADADISLGFPRSHDTDRWRAMVRKKCGLPTARVEFIQHLEWDAPKLFSVDPSEVMSKQQTAITGIRKALLDRGISAQDVETALRTFRATPIHETGRVVYMIPVTEAKEVQADEQAVLERILKKELESVFEGPVSWSTVQPARETVSPTAVIKEQIAANTNSMANLSMVLGIISLPLSCCLFGFGSLIGIAAVILGVIGVREVKQSGGDPAESRKAALGIALGGVSLVIGIVSVLLLVLSILGEGL